jgi:hypothetical protein
MVLGTKMRKRGGVVMSAIVKRASLLLLLLGMLNVPLLWASWIQDGSPVCTAVMDQYYPRVTSDAAGGAIIAWQDLRNGNWDVYAQRVNAAGVAQWTDNGISISSAVGSYPLCDITSDGSGGAFITWSDNSGGTYDIYAQEVNAMGEVQWAAGGVPICTASGNQFVPRVISDGAGGAIIVWMDNRGGYYDMYAQRVNAYGTTQWTADGVAVCTAARSQYNPDILSDGAGGAIIVWYDARISVANSDIYAQRISAAGVSQWTANGVAICTATGYQSSPRIASDGSSGAIITWYDGRNSTSGYDIYAQRITALGATQWTADGVPLCTATGTQDYPEVTFDGSGGAIVAWADQRTGSYDIYVQRVDGSGVVKWAVNGISVCAEVGDQWNQYIASDDAGGAIITWEDSRDGDSGKDIYAQRVNASGVVQWPINGAETSAASLVQERPQITTDGASGAIVVWQDYRSGGSSDIYAQRINSSGNVTTDAPYISSIHDVPNDQGGWVEITIDRSPLDDELELDYPISFYNVWRRIDDPELVAVLVHASTDSSAAELACSVDLADPIKTLELSGWPVEIWNGRCLVQSDGVLASRDFPSGTWELLGSLEALQQDQYSYSASTIADSSGASAIPYSVFVVSAHTATPSMWFISEADSGYSVDNLPPRMPSGLLAEQEHEPEGLQLMWDVNAETDISHYAVYRGSIAGFVPDSSNRIGMPIEPECFDADWRWNGQYYYKVSALDINGNESECALLRPEDTSGDDTPRAPAVSHLAQNCPNPFNPATNIVFGLAAPAHVHLRIYDSAGRLVRVIADDDRGAGVYQETWDGLDSNGRSASSGIYFCQLITKDYAETRKMVLVR